jgi:hypothetical protein
MAAADLTAKVDFQMMHLVPDVIEVTKATQSDWVNLKYPGVLVLNGGAVFTSTADTVTNSAETISYGTMKANGAVATTTGTAVIYDSASITRLLPYYILNGTTGEMMYVTADTAAGGAAGTITVRRGVLGTTAVAIADNAPFYVMNQIVLGSANVGKVFLMVLPLPSDPGTPLFKAQNSS